MERSGSRPVKVGDVLGHRFTVERVLRITPGEWVVAALERESRGRRVAIKLFRPRGAERPELIFELARREVDLLAGAQKLDAAERLPRAVVQLVGQHEGAPFVVLSLLDAPTLAERLSAAAPLSGRHVQRIGARIAAGLAALHAAGGNHGALTPDRILLRAPTDPVFQDVGLAAAFRDLAVPDDRSVVSEDGQDHIAARYASPEQLLRERAVPASDVYALGLILYEMLTGHVPLAGRTRDETRSIRSHLDPLPPRIDGVRIKGPVADLALRCLQRIPEARPSAAEAVRALAASPHRSVAAGVALALMTATLALVGQPFVASKQIPQHGGRHRLVERQKITAAGAQALEPRPDRSFSFPNAPVRVSLAQPVDRIASGRIAAVVLRDGSVSAWDPNAGFRMRRGRAPYAVNVSFEPIDIVGGANFPLLLAPDGTLTTWTQWGRPPEALARLTNVVGAASGASHLVALHRDGSVSLWDRYYAHEPPAEPVPVSGLSNVVSVAAGTDALSAALLRSGEVFSWTYRTSKRWFGPSLELHPPKTEVTGLAELPPLANAVSIAVFGHQILALDRSGIVHVCVKARRARWDRLDLPRIVSISAYSEAAAGLDEHGGVWTWGSFGFGPKDKISVTSPSRVSGLPPVVAVDVDTRESLAMDAEGGLWVWGPTTDCERPHGGLSSCQ